jgi:hypothetical protein
MASTSVRQFLIDDWHIEIKFNEAALGITGQLELGLEPQIINGRITGWLCGQDGDVAAANFRSLPANCQTLRW